mmetsp:Transcript_4845/g.9492  ORF Transcript_4845/g.9492 Transcript_4845/m.9492 type:complete len:142 (-) Transcript_4845:455-880(-)
MYDAALERVKPRYHEELYAFGQAVAADSSNVERIAEARHALEKAGGQDLVVEAAATIALFEFATRCTDSSGAEPLDSMTESMMRMYLGAGAIGRFRAHSAGSRRPGRWLRRSSNPESFQEETLGSRPPRSAGEHFGHSTCT